MEILNKEYLPPLRLAAQHGHHQIANFLLRKSAAVDNCSSSGQTSLMYAASAGDAQMCEMLLSLGASINASNSNSKTPQMLAESAGHGSVSRLLREHGAGQEDSTTASTGAPQDKLKAVPADNRRQS